MNVARLFVIHAIVTATAGVVLRLAPQLIPETVNINLDRNAYLLSYFFRSG